MVNQEEKKNKAVNEFEKGIYNSLETYSNVHRGSGHYSLITTALYERARDIIIEYLQLDKKKFVAIFVVHTD